MNSVQGGAESISCNVDMSLAQEKNDIVGNMEILEDEKDTVSYHWRKRLKKADLSGLPRTDVDSFSEGDDSSLGNVRQVMENHSLVHPVEFESVPHCFSLSMSEKKETFEDGISAEVVQTSLDESLPCSSEFQNTSFNKYDRTLIGKSDDTSEKCDSDMHALTLLESRAANGKVLNLVSKGTDTDELPGLASSGACCKDFPVPLGIKEQCSSTHATTNRKICDAGMLVSNHLEELHGEAKESISVIDGDALRGVTPLYIEEQSVASHADHFLDDTQGVARESINVLVDRAFAGYMQKKLLVLDLNGLLVDISSYVPYNYDPDAIIMKKAGTEISCKLFLFLMQLENFLTFV